MNDIVFVTGGAGYIGSHACKQLHQHGYCPVVIDSMVYGHEWAVNWGPLEKCDLRDTQFLDKLFKKYSPVAVIHFAAYSYVAESVQHPGKYYDNNVGGTISLLEAMRQNDCPRIIFSSSCSTYGKPDKLPIDENTPVDPISPYGMSKLMVEHILRDYDQAYGIKHFALRYFNAAGADLDRMVGEAHSPETHLIPLTIKSVLGVFPEITIYGTDYPTRDGTAIRDYVHVNDLASAHIMSLEKLTQNSGSQTLNLGTGNGASVKEIVRAVEKISGKKMPLKLRERRPGDPPELVACADKAKQVLNWRPKMSDLQTIISSAWEWHLKYGRQIGEI